MELILVDQSHVPVRGEKYTDSAGKHWRVDEVIHSDVLDGFFIARLGFGGTPDCDEDTWVLGRSEFKVLCRERCLRLAPSKSNVLNFSASESTGRQAA